MGRLDIFQKALVTGASSGIGKALCHLFARKNISLILHGRDLTRLKSLQEKLSVPTTIVVADLTHAEQRKELIAVIHREKPDCVINNAGVGVYGAVADVALDRQLKMIDLNVKAPVEITIESISMMRENGIKGTILNVSSIASYTLFPYFVTYAASKAFLTTFSESIYFETKPYGIRVLTSCPGQVATRFRERSSEGTQTGKGGLTVMSADFAAKEIWKQLVKGKRTHIFDLPHKLALWLLYLFPKSLRGYILGSIMKKRF